MHQAGNSPASSAGYATGRMHVIFSDAPSALAVNSQPPVRE
jgi:hypothetical protein